MIGIVAFVAARLTGLGMSSSVAQRLAKPILAVGAIIAAGILLWIVIAALVRSHDEQVIEKHDSKVNLDVIERVQNMDKMAADQRVSDAVRETQENAAIQEVIRDAPDSEVSDARRAMYRCRGLQRSAREAGHPAPRCG